MEESTSIAAVNYDLRVTRGEGDDKTTVWALKDISHESSGITHEVFNKQLSDKVEREISAGTNRITIEVSRRITGTKIFRKLNCKVLTVTLWRCSDTTQWMMSIGTEFDASLLIRKATQATQLYDVWAIANLILAIVY